MSRYVNQTTLGWETLIQVVSLISSPSMHISPYLAFLIVCARTYPIVYLES